METNWMTKTYLETNHGRITDEYETKLFGTEANEFPRKRFLTLNNSERIFYSFLKRIPIDELLFKHEELRTIFNITLRESREVRDVHDGDETSL